MDFLKKDTDMNFKDTYTGTVLSAIKSLLTGMKVTFCEFFTRKVTEQYPENRKKLKIPERHRAILIMPHDENDNNRCIACGLCQQSCPNGTIKITTKTEWEKYRYLFQMHLNLKLIEQHLRLGRIYDKKVAYFYDAPWKDEYLRKIKG